jgi:translocation and assembly module TamB
LSEADDDTAPATERAPPRTRGGGLHLSLLAELVVAAAVVLLLVVAVRYGPVTDTGRAALTAYLDGLRLGPWGRLHVSPLRGDVWSDFAFDQASVSDAQGVWLNTGRIEVGWRPIDLLRRRFHATAITIDRLTVFRRPVLTPTPAAPPGGKAPLGLAIDSVRLRLESRSAFSARPGLFDVAASLKLNRSGGMAGALKMQSLLRAADGLDAHFDVGWSKHLIIDATAREGFGGAIAGTLGLPPSQPFAFVAKADGIRNAGHFRLTATCGGRTPAHAEGIWDKTGGQANVALSLAASSLTSGLAVQLGPQLDGSLTAHDVGRSMFDISGILQADNSKLTFAGIVDGDRQAAPKGLRVAAVIKDLTRITTAPAMGSGAFNGTLSGGMADWRLAGALSINKLAEGGYSLARADGPVSLALVKRELKLQASLMGQGGAGQGFLAALAGARPRAILQASQLPDGRTLIRTLSAEGAGLSLAVSGDRNLFGGLNLKGTARLSNLAAAQAGAAGAVDVRWSASQARATTPWSWVADAQGQGLAIGVAEVDRLLGPKPAMHLQADFAQGAIAVTAARLSGAAANLGARGLIGKDGGLKLALDWTAQGPFAVGPLEVAGKASGSGDLTGTWGAPHADLLADFERIDLPYLTVKPAHVVLSFARAGADTDGLIAINGGGDYGPAHAKAGFHFVEGGVELKDIDALAGGASAKGSLALRKAAPLMADLAVNVGPGAFVSEGTASGRVKIADAGGGPAAAIQLTAQNLVPRGSGVAIQTARFSAEGPLSHLPYSVDAQALANGAPLRFKGAGVATQTGSALSISFDGGGRLRKADFRTLTPAQFTFDGPQSTSRLSLAVGGGRADISTRQDAQGVAASGKMAGVDIAAVDQEMVGKFDADFSLAGKGASLSGDLNARLTDARSRDAASSQALTGTIKAVLSGSAIQVDASGGGAKSTGGASVSVVLPAETSAAPFRIAINQTRPIQGRFDADGEVEPIWDLLFGGERSLGGRVTARGTLGGTLASPVLIGHAAMANGKLEDAATGLKLRNMTADVDLTNNLVSVKSFSASDAKNGTVSGDGRLSLIKGGESTLTLKVKGFQLINNDAAKATATGAVTVTRGGDGHARLSGELNIDNAEISAINRSPPGVVSMDVIERNRPVGQVEGASAAPANSGPAVALDIKLRAARGVYLKGLGLNAEMSLDANVTGDTARPQLQGTARVLRGAYDFAGKRFDIDDSSVVYLDASADRIRLDLSATRDDPTLIAVIRIKGTAAKPEVTLTSTPTLPSDEVLSQVLFGKSAAQLSGVEAAQLAAAVTTLATGGGFDVIGGLRSFVRLDRLALGADTLGAPTVSGGKYVSEHVYIELTGGGKELPSAQVEVNAGRGLSIISQVGGLEGAKLAVRWRLNYGKQKVTKSAK